LPQGDEKYSTELKKLTDLVCSLVLPNLRQKQQLLEQEKKRGDYNKLSYWRYWYLFSHQENRRVCRHFFIQGGIQRIPHSNLSKKKLVARTTMPYLEICIGEIHSLDRNISFSRANSLAGHITVVGSVLAILRHKNLTDLASLAVQERR
jgi:hypothetical protein